MQREIGITDLRAAIDQSIAGEDLVSARALLARLWQEHPGPTTAGFINSRVERLRPNLTLTQAKVSILRSYTLEPVVPILRAAGALSGLALDVQVGDFNTYAQDILNPQSNLYQFGPDIVILAVQTRDLAPELWDGFADLAPGAAQIVADRVIGELHNLVRAFRERSQAYLLIHTLELPSSPASGVLDALQSGGQAATIRAINQAIGDLVRGQTGVYLVDYDGLIARCGRDAWYDERKWQTMRMPIRAEWLARLAHEWLRLIQPLTGRTCKALVVDLDNTLWGGVIGEDGMQGIKIGSDYPGSAYLALQRIILNLYQRGVILAICSKNNRDDALDVLANHPDMLLRQHHFAALRINWESKAENLRSIAKELNIGIDSLAFIDDNPVECQLIRSQTPEITVIELSGDPAAYAQLLRAQPVFERLTLSVEDRERGRYYAEQRQRSEIEQSSASVEEFLASLQTQVRIAPVTQATIARTAQLTQKTNQFNLTTRRYSEQQIAQMASDNEWLVLTAQATDRFGDHGLIGVVILHRKGAAWDIDTMLLSCRVIGRTVETAILATVAGLALSRGARHLTGQFIPTKKNAPARDFFPSHHFLCVEEGAEGSRWSLDLMSEAVIMPAWINCQLVADSIPG